ncbi:glutamate--tRNA ligase [Mesomycoplasma ovipneumoniae]|uniref:glutamate--tRNA ligase n=1 Tax=Mesomycoplasma ovipneumoniae TaxID=29562 RepID=UPI0028A916C9|nr:glutamate--tRNA ligase [Mesomycoplasma ovipneumoniae]MDW2933501.1 glutamate--tRNA ligase [Mesomycoplasma ovipneumoniae]WNM15991.1 glutamate--tRNA ligase [Mesomycoplasma ovipneumoniae]
MKIRTRYAPSPTGFLHIGGARTALINYLFAKHHGGDFILRIEDTDTQRNIKDGERSQIENLEWLGIFPDEKPGTISEYGPYRQSEKIDRYQKLAQELVQKGFAYYAFDNASELEEQKKEQEKQGIFSFRYDKNWLKISDQEKQKRLENNEFVIRFAVDKNKNYCWNDLVRGKICFEGSAISDWVIIKSDGFPTYNFAVVVDDCDMKITHIFRGEEHISNTPKQIALYEAFSFEKPEFGHLTIITDKNGKKLSKRDSSLFQFIEDYKNQGYHSHAVFNFLALLGWTSADSREFFDREELIKAFDFKRLSKAPSYFDTEKLNWFSKSYISKMQTEQILPHLNLEINSEWNRFFVETFQKSAVKYSDFFENLDFFTKPQDSMSQKIIDLLEQSNQQPIQLFAQKIDYDDWQFSKIENLIKEIGQTLNIKGKNLLLPLRLATTWAESGPELARAIWLLGPQIIQKRLKKWR